MRASWGTLLYKIFFHCGYKRTGKIGEKGEFKEVDKKENHPSNAHFLEHLSFILTQPLLPSPASKGHPSGHTAMPQQSPANPKTLNPDV